MKYILATAFVIAIVWAAASMPGSVPTPEVNTVDGEVNIFPTPTNYVTDLNDSLTDQTEEVMNTTLKDLSDKGTAQIAVMVLDSTSPYSIEEYGIKLADAWKVGEEGKDNGVILILATEDRKVRIEVGKGVEGIIPDAVAGRIIDEEMIDSLKIGDWDSAVLLGVGEIINRLTK